MSELHPMAVHFPIAVVLLWPVVDALGLLLKRPDVSKVGLGLLFLGVIVSLVATASGQAAFEVALDAGVAPEILNTHADDANVVPWALLLIAAVRLGAAHKLGAKGHVLGILLGVLMWPFVIGIGNSGGALVYEHAVGVKSVRKAASSEAPR